MTRQEWLACTDPEPMLELLRDKVTDRKLRLFACACCRHTSSFADAEWKRMAAHRRSAAEVEMVKGQADLARRAADVAERYADGLASLAELQALFSAPGDDEIESCYAGGADAVHAATGSAYRARHCARYMNPQKFTRLARWLTALAGPYYGVESLPDHDRERSAQSNLLRDIFGDPFRPIAFSPEWRTDTVATLARTLYESREFGAMPILADALQDAGCDNPDILEHCRNLGIHIRGCWVVDLVLSKQ